MKSVKVSVLMPVYNTPEEYLRQAIESILNQTFTDFELIICNDGSTNNAVQVIQSYSDNRIRFIQNEKNLGLCATRNKLMQLANGEYVAWADSDDISVATRLEKQVAFLDTHPDVSVLGAWYERFPEYFVPHLPETVGLVDMLKWCAVAQPVAMYRRKDFEINYDEDTPIAEDYDLWTRALITGLKVRNIQEVLLKYRWYPNNTSHTRAEEMEQMTKKVQQKIVAYLSGEKEVQERLQSFFNLRAQNNEIKNVYFCGIRLLKIKRNGNKTKGYLFGFLPIFRKKENSKRFKIFGLPFKIKSNPTDLPQKNNILYIQKILEQYREKSPKILVVIPSDPIEAYEQKGQRSILQNYYNPKNFFDIVFCLSPLEKGIQYKYGMHIIGVNDSIYKKALRIIKPDVVRVYGGYGVIKFAVSNHIAPSIPLVVSIHDKRPEWLLDEILSANYVICVSKACQQIVQDRGVPESKIIPFSDRVDCQIFHPQKKENVFKHQGKDIHNILCVGRRDPVKNIETLIRALKLLPPNYYLTQIGQSNDDLKTLAKNLNVNDRITWIDKIENTDLANFYNACDCFCLLSLSEGFGIVYIEAAACGCPIVASDIEPVNQYLENKKTACLVKDYTNPTEVANAIQYMCSEDGKKIGKNAVKIAQKFDLNLVEQKEADIYAKILNKGK